MLFQLVALALATLSLNFVTNLCPFLSSFNLVKFVSDIWRKKALALAHVKYDYKHKHHTYMYMSVCVCSRTKQIEVFKYLMVVLIGVNSIFSCALLALCVPVAMLFERELTDIYFSARAWMPFREPQASWYKWNGTALLWLLLLSLPLGQVNKNFIFSAFLEWRQIYLSERDNRTE